MAFTKTRVIFRADAGHTIGLGHIVRCLALADTLKENFDILFICSSGNPSVTLMINGAFTLKELESSSVSSELSELKEFLKPNDILIIDGYSFDEKYQIGVKSCIHKLVMIDDVADRYFYADMIINHGGEFIANQYRTEPYTKKLLGFKYLLVRKEFKIGSRKDREIKNIESVFICMGGSDPFQITPKVLRACMETNFIKKIYVVLGSAYGSLSEVNDIIDSSGNSIEVIVEQNISPERMVELIGYSEIAVCPSSSISLEVCCVGSGLLTGTVIKNQEAIHQQLIKNNCARTLGDLNEVSVHDIVKHLNKMNSIATITELISNQRISTSDFRNEDNLLQEFRGLTYGRA